MSRTRMAHLYHLAYIGHEDLKSYSKEELSVFITYTTAHPTADLIEKYVPPNMEHIVCNNIVDGGPPLAVPPDDTGMDDPMHDTNKIAQVGVSLLHVVVSQGHTELVRVLLDIGCDINTVTSHYKHNVLHIALLGTEEPPLELLEMLLEAGVDTTSVSRYMKGTALHMAVQYLYPHLIAPLVAAGCPVDALSDQGLTALFMAVNSRHLECIRNLVHAGASADITTPMGWTPLFLAVRSNRIDIPQLLVSGNCDVNIKGHGGTALHHAIYHANLKSVKLLLEAGADPDAQSAEGGHTPLTVAACNNSKSIVEVLISHGCDINKGTAHGYTALHLAAWDGHMEIVDILLEQKALHDTPTKDYNTPLALACHGNKPEIISRLLPQGCSVNNKDKDRDTPLHYVAYNGCLDSLNLLLKYGANPDIQNNWQATPLWNAVHMKFVDVVYELLRCNVTLNVPSKGINQRAQTDHIVLIYTTPRSPFFVALDRGLFEVAASLVLAGMDMAREDWFWKREYPATLEQNEGEKKKLLTLVCSPLSLKHICRGYVRRRCGSKVHSIVKQMEIPYTLKDFLLLKYYR